MFGCCPCAKTLKSEGSKKDQKAENDRSRVYEAKSKEERIDRVDKLDFEEKTSRDSIHLNVPRLK